MSIFEFVETYMGEGMKRGLQFFDDKPKCSQAIKRNFLKKVETTLQSIKLVLCLAPRERSCLLFRKESVRGTGTGISTDTTMVQQSHNIYMIVGPLLYLCFVGKVVTVTYGDSDGSDVTVVVEPDGDPGVAVVGVVVDVEVRVRVGEDVFAVVL